MTFFADRLIQAVQAKGTSCIVGLDPRLHGIPDFILKQATRSSDSEEAAVRRAPLSPATNRATNCSLGRLVHDEPPVMTSDKSPN